MKSNDNNTSLIDNIYTKYGYGPKIFKLLTFAFLIYLIEGISVTAFPYMIVPLKKYYEIPETLTKIVTSILFLGIFLGAVFLGSLVKLVSRDKLIITCAFLMVITNTLVTILKNVYVLIVSRFFLGLACGIISPTTTSLIVEYLPIKNRFLTLSYLNLGYRFGQLVLLVLILSVIPHFEIENIPIILISISVLSLFVFIFVLFSVKESPRRLIQSGKEGEAIEILQSFIDDTFTEVDRKIIVYQTKNTENQKLGDFLDLFKEGYMASTILLICINIVVNMVYFGTLLVANLTLKNLHDNEMSVIMQNICIVLIGIVSGLILSPFGEIKSLGRKGVLILLSILAFIVLNLCHLLKHTFFLWYGMTLSLSGMIANGTIIYSSELYSAKIRDRGTGLLFSVGRLGGFCGQLLYITLYEQYIWSPYYFAAASMIVVALLIFLLPYETYSIALDHVIVPVKQYYTNIEKSDILLDTSVERKKFMSDKSLYKIV